MQKFNTWEATKIIAVIATVAFLWFHGEAFIDAIGKPAVIQPPTKIMIDENAVKLAAITASDRTANELKSEFKERESKILAAWEKDRKETKERLDELGMVNGKLSQTVDLLSRNSDHVYTAKPGKENLNQEFKKIYAKDAKGNKFPVAWVIYYPNKEKDKWKTGTYPLEYYIDIIETQNTNGTFNRSAEFNIVNNQMKETKGQLFPVKIKDIKWAKYEMNEKSFHWWNPRLALSGIFTSDIFAPSISLSTSSYGKTDVDSMWLFPSVSIGIEGDDNIAIGFSPFLWNVGKAGKIPFIKNVFVGPDISWTKEGTSYGIVLSVPL